MIDHKLIRGEMLAPGRVIPLKEYISLLHPMIHAYILLCFCFSTTTNGFRAAEEYPVGLSRLGPSG